ncbi:MAG: hypothetical protein AAB927_01255 [Patescibacteria group bacterium]|mgnify:CR=1 FL=1
MSSKWLHLKERAVVMRKRGAAMRDIEKRLGISKSTLHYWFRSITLSDYHVQRLKKRADTALIKARRKAVKWHNAQKALRMKLAAEDGARSLANIDFANDAIAELALAILYLGEGMKKSVVTAMGNSDPLILKFFVATLVRLYKISPHDMKCEIHIRADQDPKKIKRYWSKTLGIPTSNFGKPSIDIRTAGRATYPHYKGVCIVRCSRVAIQRKLVYIATTFCRETAEQCAVSSIGRALH